MACGCLVVSTNVAGLADLPTLHADATPVSITEKIFELISNYDDIRQLQMNATRNTFNQKNWEKGWMRVIEK